MSANCCTSARRCANSRSSNGSGEFQPVSMRCLCKVELSWCSRQIKAHDLSSDGINQALGIFDVELDLLPTGVGLKQQRDETVHAVLICRFFGSYVGHNTLRFSVMSGSQRPGIPIG